MKSLLLSIFITTTLLFCGVVSAVSLNPTQQQKLNEITDLLQENPDVIEGLHVSLKQYIEGQKSVSNTLKQNYDYLYNNPLQPYFGSENPELTIINFTDYNCPYCKRLESGLADVINKYPQIRVVNIILPFQQRMIPGLETSTAWYALNVWENNRSKFAEVHRLMIAKPSRHDRDSIMKIATMTGTLGALSATQTKKQLVKKNEQVFSQLGLRGTPSLIIGDEIIPGLIPDAQLQAKIKAQLK